MLVLVQANIMTVGLGGKEELLRELPIRLITMRSGKQAARSLKNHKVDGVISKWNLDDMEDGRFLKGLKAARPDVPTIVFIASGDWSQEIAARSLGVSAVLTDEADDDYFRETVADVLGLKGVIAIKAITSVKTEQAKPAMLK